MKTQLIRIDGTLIDESDTLTIKELVVKNKHRLQNANMQHAYMWGADMQNANMRGADMQNADMRGADMQNANMQHADMRGANIDYSAWPLWCGTYNVKVDKAIAAQLAMHFCWLDCDDPEVKAAQNAIEKLARQCKHWKERE